MQQLTRSITCAFLGAMSLFLAGCGNNNGENPFQAVATLVPKTGALGKSTEARESQEKGFPRSDGDERYVAFDSAESSVLEDDTNRVTDVFVYDRQTKQTTRVSVNSTGAQANGGSFAPEVTHDGRFVAFESLATNLVPDDTNRQRDVFVHDWQTKQTTRVSMDSEGAQANNFSQAARLSQDGRYVVFESLASNLVPGDTNGVIDVFVHDRQTKRTTRVSVVSGGAQANNMSVNPSISADGRYVMFESFATNLLPDKADGPKQTFVHDRQTGQTIRVPSDGMKGPVTSFSAPMPGREGKMEIPAGK
jgi:Tol biopolymer transport system component